MVLDLFVVLVWVLLLFVILDACFACCLILFICCFSCLFGLVVFVCVFVCWCFVLSCFGLDVDLRFCCFCVVIMFNFVLGGCVCEFLIILGSVGAVYLIYVWFCVCDVLCSFCGFGGVFLFCVGLVICGFALLVGSLLVGLMLRLNWFDLNFGVSWFVDFGLWHLDLGFCLALVLGALVVLGVLVVSVVFWCFPMLLIFVIDGCLFVCVFWFLVGLGFLLRFCCV